MSSFVKLKDIAHIITGFPFKGELYSDFGIRTVRGENVTEGKLRWDTIKCWNQPFDKAIEYFLREDDVVIGMDGSKVGKNKARIRRDDLPLLLAQRVACVRAKKNVSQLFLFYLINNPIFEFYVFKTQTGSSVPHISKSQIEDFQIPKLEFSTQTKIAAILSSLDDKIEINNKIKIELDKMTKTLYDYWFVQFDFPDANEKPYKSSGGEMVYNVDLKREIPDGWNVKTLNDLSSYISRGISPKYINEGGVCVLNQKCIRNRTVVYEESRRNDNSKRDAISKQVHLYDILVNSTGVGTLGRTAIVNHLPEDFITVDSHVTIVRANEDLINKLFFGFSLLEKQKEIEGFSNGSTGQVELSRYQLQGINLIVPPKEIQIKFERIYKNYLDKIAVCTKQNKQLVSLRDWLLPMLMNGQLKVVDGEEIVNEQLAIIEECLVDYQLNLTDKDKKIRRKMLAAYIINQSLKDTSFGKTKFEKLLHLIECHIVRGDYNQRYSVQAAGPYDGGFTKVFWDEVTKAKWFKIEELGKLRRIMPAENHVKSLVDYGFLSSDLKLMINDFIEEFKNTNYERPEIISTLYAVWNNRIIRNEMITDELLKEDFLEWDAQKVKYKDRLDNGLEWMREKGIIPDGWGSEIRRAKK